MICEVMANLRGFAIVFLFYLIGVLRPYVPLVELTLSTMNFV